ncbi:MAG: autoinducer binding domain-containing protein [Burkholderiaceae bacterium]
MLQGGFTEVLGSQSRDEFRDEVVGFTKRLGFETVSATVVIDHLLGEAEFITVDNTPQAYRDSFQNRENWRLDPVMQHCKRQSMPIIWSQKTYVSQGLGDKWEEQARFGYRNGIALALHMPEGRHFFLGVDRDQPVPMHAGELTRVVADLQLFAVHAQDAALRILAPGASEPGNPALTPRELETLRWTMEGRTAREVGDVLGITERTAALHVNNATHKLGCVNKHQAVLKALRLGLIR